MAHLRSKQAAVINTSVGVSEECLGPVHRSAPLGTTSHQADSTALPLNSGKASGLVVAKSPATKFRFASYFNELRNPVHCPSPKPMTGLSGSLESLVLTSDAVATTSTQAPSSWLYVDLRHVGDFTLSVTRSPIFDVVSNDLARLVGIKAGVPQTLDHAPCPRDVNIVRRHGTCDDGTLF